MEEKPLDAPLAPAPSARARATPNAELGRRFAELLAEPHAHQLGVCGKLRLNYRTYKRWMAAETEGGTDLDDFQGLVNAALEDARVRDIQAMEQDLEQLQGPGVAKAGALVNMRTFHHTNRFKRFYGSDEDPKKLEMSGPDGKPLQQEHSGKLDVAHGLTPEASRKLKLQFLGISEERLERGRQRALKADGDE
jgi:hypothetical protein